MKVATKQRMMHWTCSKCGGKWSEPMWQSPDAKPNETQRDDGHETSFCDRCLDKMG